MGKIKQLSSTEAQKIAAGEVVDRPTNVVKELLENALDANATIIALHIKQGGHLQIRIVDNGCGMDKDDALHCFEQHATSKISSVEELSHIQTFGFRGEALASISAVSNVTLITKEANTDHGYCVTRKDQQISLSEHSCPTGTDISINDLFYNVPARKKFLKKAETEWRQIVLLFQAFCFQHLNIHFKLYHDEKLIHNCPPTESLQQRIEQLWHSHASHHTITMNEYSGNGFTFKGIITNHHYTRYDRNHIFLFVNNRWIKNSAVSKAVLKGYKNVLPPGKFPAACISITVNPDQVDINIHPRKEEVQFLHPRRIETALTNTITTTLETNLSSQLTQSPNNTQSNNAYAVADQTLTAQPSYRSPSFTAQSFEKPYVFASRPKQQHSTTPYKRNDLEYNLAIQDTDQPYDANKNIESKDQSIHTSTIIGQLHNTYILLHHEQGLYVVDQHAAHERVLYEQFKQRFGNLETIQLLFPPVIHLHDNDAQLLEKHTELFTLHGIALQPSGHNQFTISTAPVHVKHIDFEELAKTVLSWIHEHDNADQDELFKLLHEKLRAQMACKAAVKAGDTLTIEQMNSLLRDLHTTDNRFSCPHGRPTGWLLHSYEIEKKFKRRA